MTLLGGAEYIGHGFKCGRKPVLKRATLLAAVCLWVTTSDAQAYGYCSEPSAPGKFSKPSIPNPPSKPYCINQFTNTHTCSDWEISSHNQAVDQYNDQLTNYRRERETYVNKLVDFANEAEEYAVCEIESLDR